MAKKAAKSKKLVKKTKRTARTPWSAADLKALKTLIKQNTPTRLIAMKLKRSIASIYSKVSNEGISLAPTNRSPRD